MRKENFTVSAEGGASNEKMLENLRETKWSFLLLLLYQNLLKAVIYFLLTSQHIISAM